MIVRFEGEPEDEAGEFAEERGTVFVTLRRDADVLDTWFSSGIWPIGTLGWPEKTDDLARYYPTSVLVTGFDIIFFWVARMMMMQLELTGEVPFRDVYIHALVRDEKGKKMSKSLGNILDPIELIDQYGADAVRFTLAALAALGRDVKLSKDRIAGYRNFGTKLWNAARFAEMNDCRPDPAFDPAAVTLAANRWIVGETGRARETLDAALTAYRFNDAANALHAFVWGKVCDWYVELAKPLLEDAGHGGRDAGDDGLGARPVPGPDAAVHALRHRGAVGPDRRAAEAARPCRLAGLWLRADRPGDGRRDELGLRAHRRDPLGAVADARPGRGARAADRPRPRRRRRRRRCRATRRWSRGWRVSTASRRRPRRRRGR